MLLLLALVIGGLVGLVRVTRQMDTSQRVVAVVVFLLALVYLMRKALEMGILGNRTD